MHREKMILHDMWPGDPGRTLKSINRRKLTTKDKTKITYNPVPDQTNNHLFAGSNADTSTVTARITPTLSRRPNTRTCDTTATAATNGLHPRDTAVGSGHGILESKH